MENGIVSEEKNKPVLDEQTLGKLLEAAYVLQEHNREMRSLELSMELKRERVEAEDRAGSQKFALSAPARSTPTADYTFTLAQIVETQHHIQSRQYGLEEAMKLVAERVVEIARAGGSAIGVLESPNVRYRAVAGMMTPGQGNVVPIEKSLCLPCVKTSQVFRCPDVNSEFLFDTEECRKRGIGSMIAVPVFHDGGVVGGLELYYCERNSFTEQDVHTCQLMAGLITEGLVRDEELTWKKSLATERAAMLNALERLQPNLAALVGPTPVAKEMPVNEPTPQASPTQTCRKCGHVILEDEQFCGQCGSPRSNESAPPNMQSKVAALWQMQEARKKDSTVEPVEVEQGDPTGEHLPEDLNELLSKAALTPVEQEVPELFKTSAVPLKQLPELAELGAQLGTELESGFTEEAEAPPRESGANKEENTAAITQHKPAPPANWSSAASARAFLEQLASSNRSPSLTRFWNMRRGDIYLAIAVILVACVIRWGIWSGHSAGATGIPAAATTHHKSPEADLSLFDRMLISLGLADPPDSPEDQGNPSVQVWLDTRTGLYYCPGADLYGKTPKGNFAAQRQAQLDHFQPAYRKACN